MTRLQRGIGGLVLVATAFALWPADPLQQPLRFQALEFGPRQLNRGQPVERVDTVQGGFELSWRFEREPPGDGPLRLRFSTSVTPRSSGELGWRLGQALFGPSTWVDASGQRFALQTSAVGEGLEIEVPQWVLRKTTWPAVLDPLLLPAFFIDDPVLGPVARTPPYVVAGGPRAMGIFRTAVNLECRLWELDGGWVSTSVLLYDGGGVTSSLTNSGSQYLLALNESSSSLVRRVDPSCVWLGPSMQVGPPGSVTGVATSDGGWWVVSSLVPGDAGPHLAYRFLDHSGGMTPGGFLERADPFVTSTEAAGTLFVASAGRSGASPVVTIDCLSTLGGNTQLTVNRNLNYGLVSLAAGGSGLIAVLIGDPTQLVRIVTPTCAVIATSAPSTQFLSLFSADTAFGLVSVSAAGTTVRSLSMAGSLGPELLIAPKAYPADVVWSSTPLIFDNLSGGFSSKRSTTPMLDALGPAESLTIAVNQELFETSTWHNGRGWVIWADDRGAGSRWLRTFDAQGPLSEAISLGGGNVIGRCIAGLGQQKAILGSDVFGRYELTVTADGGLQMSGLIPTTHLAAQCLGRSGAQTAWLVSHEFDFDLFRYVLWVNRFHLDGGAEAAVQLRGPESFTVIQGVHATSSEDGERLWVAATPFFSGNPDSGRLFELGANDPMPTVSGLNIATIGAARTSSALCLTTREPGANRITCTFDDGGLQRDSVLPDQGPLSVWADGELLHLRVSLSDGGALWGASSPDGGVRWAPQSTPPMFAEQTILRAGTESFAVLGTLTIDGGDRAVRRVVISALLHLEDGRPCLSDFACISGVCENGACVAERSDAGFDAGASIDAGASDAGASIDAGLGSDAGDDDGGWRADAGGLTDAGGPADGGTTVSDGGSLVPDGGQSASSGSYDVRCSCSEVEGLSGVLALLALIRARRPAVRSKPRC